MECCELQLRHNSW